MAVSIALQPPVTPDVAIDAPSKGFDGLGGLWKRAKQVGASLKNVKPSEVAWMGASAAIGIGAKALAVKVASVGVAAGVISGGATLFVPLGIAVVGGALVGLTKASIKHFRDTDPNKKFFTLANLKTVGISTGISAATLGYSEIFEMAAGDSFTHVVGKALGKVADFATDKLVDLVSGTDAFAAARDSALADSHNYASGLVKPLSTPTYTAFSDTAASAPTAPAAPAATMADTHTASRPAAHQTAHHGTRAAATAQPTGMSKAALKAALAAAQEKANDEYALERMRQLVLETTGVAAAEDATAADLAKQFHPDNSERFLNALKQNAPRVTALPADAAAPVAQATKSFVPRAADAAPATATADKVVGVKDIAKTDFDGTDPQDIIVRAPNGAEIRMPAAPNMDAEFNTVKAAIHTAAIEELMTEQYVAEFGGTPPEGMSVEEMAGALSPNPQNLLAETSKAAGELLSASDNAANLDPAKLAGTCVTDLPKTRADFLKQGGVLPNTCVVGAGKEVMGEGDYVIVRDAAEASPSSKKGLRVLFSKLSEKTSEFIARAVGQETLTDMAAQKLAMAPQ